MSSSRRPLSGHVAAHRMASPVPVDFAHLRSLIIAQFSLGPDSIHGPNHWRMVERNGLLLAKETGAIEVVVRLFALFHESRRQNESTDPEHGLRGAQFARSLHGSALEVSPEELNLLELACRNHTSGHLHPDPTIGTCWDADRLDLGRVGIIPEVHYMSTDFARRIARKGLIHPFIR